MLAELHAEMHPDLRKAVPRWCHQMGLPRLLDRCHLQESASQGFDLRARVLLQAGPEPRLVVLAGPVQDC